MPIFEESQLTCILVRATADTRSPITVCIAYFFSNVNGNGSSTLCATVKPWFDKRQQNANLRQFKD